MMLSFYRAQEHLDLSVYQLDVSIPAVRRLTTILEPRPYDFICAEGDFLVMLWQEQDNYFLEIRRVRFSADET